MPCSLCDWWSRSDVVQRGINTNTKQCKVTGGKIQSNSETCKYFNPVYFYCDQFEQRITFTQCLARRRNEKNIVSFDPCKKCRQFDKDIREVIEKYYLNSVPIRTPRHLKIKGNEMSSGSNRKIKRRTKPNPISKDKSSSPIRKGSERVIKRRDKTIANSLSKAIRIIKRRK